MANLSTSSRPQSARRLSRPLGPSMTSKQLEAYLMAREVIRRLKPASSAWVPPDVQLRKAGP